MALPFGCHISWIGVILAGKNNSEEQGEQSHFGFLKQNLKMVRSLLCLFACMLATVVWSQRSPIRVAMIHEDDVEQIKAIVLAHAGEDTGTDEYKAKVQVRSPEKRLFPTRSQTLLLCVIKSRGC